MGIIKIFFALLIMSVLCGTTGYIIYKTIGDIKKWKNKRKGE